MNHFKKYPFQLLLVLVIAAVIGWYSYSQVSNEDNISTFEECAAAGYPVMESYPEQCRTPGGKHFVRDIDEQIKVIGETTCLPHKGDGPHTLECAFGIKDENGTHYQLGLPQESMFDFQTGKKMIVTGSFTPEPDSKYDILGLINVTTFEEVSE